MKTEISIPDDVFEEAERLAARAKSRSQLYTEAMRDYLARQGPDSATARLDEVVAELPGSGDRLVTATVRRRLEQVEW